MNIFQRFIYGRESGGTRRSGNPSVEMAGRPGSFRRKARRVRKLSPKDPEASTGRPGGSGNFHQKTRRTRKLPPEGPEVPETFAKRPGGPAIFCL